MTQENNSVYYILKAIKLIVSIRATNSLSDLVDLPELVAYSDTNLEQVGNILSTRNLRRTAWHFLDYGASTALILQKRLDISHEASYRYIRDLRVFNFIAPAMKLRSSKDKKGGPRPKVWMVPDATIDMINEAQRLHYRLSSRKYKIAEKVAQSLLDDYITPKQKTEITYREIIIHVNTLKIPFKTPDIAGLVAQYLNEKGIKVWR